MPSCMRSITGSCTTGAMHLVKDSAAAEDLVHETFLTVTKNMDKIIGADYMKNWGYLFDHSAASHI